ncbi:hypothetical protein N7492_006353 [Penicillium capsulatum]|uniref:Myb-like domain-containing protein n=1 Tax=Penicillium capsulatum TaxID=69766 RepID=A0A9W9I5G3_9EURO|nr:hypothetical protein N7492_006353 [Penicillium capsulatum]KAJ6109002.1 hypothetical protein N7512_008839 [Penicillium capsulatum]
MPSDTFRLESFRPWNPFQDKTQPPQDSLDVCHYPSPVSITATSTSSNSRASPRYPNVHSYTSERHPLPPRPPVEVCLNDSLPQEINNQRQPSVENQTSCVDLGAEALDFKDIPHLQDLSSPGGEAHPLICDSLGQDSQYPLGFESSDLGLARTASQHTQVSHAESSVLTRECWDTMIDPEILNDYPLRDIEQTPASRETSDMVALSHSPEKTVRGRSRSTRPRSQRAMKPGRQRSKIKKVSVVNNQRMENAGQSTRAKSLVKMSFSILRDQFSSLPIEERLQFLSWLFEGALSQCLHVPSRSNDVSKSNDTSKEEGITTSSAEQSSEEARVAHGMHTCSSRKGLPWLAEENRLLVQLRKEESLAWSEVFKRFDQRFPGRSQGSIQVYWSTTLKKQLAS